MTDHLREGVDPDAGRVQLRKRTLQDREQRPRGMTNCNDRLGPAVERGLVEGPGDCFLARQMIEKDVPVHGGDACASDNGFRNRLGARS